MPRKPSFENPLRLVRNALALSQAEFAKEMRVSEAYIQAIELGLRKISDDLADEVAFRFGVTPESLKRVQGVPRPLSGPAIPLEDALQLWRRKFAEFEAEGLGETLTTDLISHYSRLLGKASTKGKALLLQYLFARWLAETAQALQLEDALPPHSLQPESQKRESSILLDVFAMQGSWAGRFHQNADDPSRSKGQANHD